MDAVLVNKYLCELRVAKKLGRKERKQKEAQAVVAAAAASSRISSLRKDLLDGSANQENLVKLNTTSGTPGYCSQLMPRARETVPKVSVHMDCYRVSENPLDRGTVNYVRSYEVLEYRCQFLGEICFCCRITGLIVESTVWSRRHRAKEHQANPGTVIKKVSKLAAEGGNRDSGGDGSLWKRRLGGVALKSLELQQIHHRRHQCLLVTV
ncbi:hypothetical protein NL676_039600 [Syzygium grande]|nr:hypothetical protein NL676_039600 [Syzygium grande]